MLNQRQVVFHGFSIGAFIYTQLWKLLSEGRQQGKVQELGQTEEEEVRADGGPQAARDLSQRIAGLVLDSPAYLGNTTNGIANSVTSVPVLRSLINSSLQLYLAAFPKSVTFHYLESHRVYHHLHVPALILYSPNDHVSDAAVTESYTREWQAKGLAVTLRRFPGTTHVSHFRQFPQEYAQAVDAFVSQLQLAPSSPAKVDSKVVGVDPKDTAQEVPAAASAADPVLVKCSK